MNREEKKYKWIKFSDQYPTKLKKIVARHLKTPDIIGIEHYFNPDSDNAKRANLYEFEWSYID